MTKDLPTTRVPIISFELSMPGPLGIVPTYISNASYNGLGLTTKGNLNGQPFFAEFPSVMSAPRESWLYFSLRFPLESIGYYARVIGTEGPAEAINYTNKEPEERDAARQEIIRNLLTFRPKGRFVFDSDGEINREHLGRLREIFRFLSPTILDLYQFAESNEDALKNSRGKGTIDSLVVPQNQ